MNALPSPEETFELIANGSLSRLQEIYAECGAPFLEQSEFQGTTILLKAIAENKTNIALWILEATNGSQVNVVSSNGLTPYEEVGPVVFNEARAKVQLTL